MDVVPWETDPMTLAKNQKELEMERETDTDLKKFKVTIVAHRSCTYEVFVQAKNKEEAEEEGFDLYCNNEPDPVDQTTHQIEESAQEISAEAFEIGAKEQFMKGP